MRLFLKRAGWSALVALLLLVLASSLLLRRQLESRGPTLDPPALVEVERGESVGNLGKMLAKQGLTAHPRLFAALARWRGLDRQIRSGRYEFSGDATVGEIIDTFVSGPQKLEFVVIPEGLNIAETASLLEAAGLGKASLFRELSHDPGFAAELGVPGDTLEGYLFPDTYAFAVGASPDEILAHMTDRFFAIRTPEMVAKGEALGLSPADIVSLASLIEEEAALAEERRLISAVFHNRLRRGMKLQSDPTAIYGVEGHSGRVRPADLERKTPWNTYQIAGLPRGPISSPGRASLEAAVDPAEDRRILYFVARDDRSHVFSRSYREHRRAIRKNR